MQQLRERGLILTVMGRGTFVAESADQAVPDGDDQPENDEESTTS
jgi:DNA-binding GntR family transcriptional regulator